MPKTNKVIARCKTPSGENVQIFNEDNTLGQVMAMAQSMPRKTGETFIVVLEPSHEELSEEMLSKN